MVELTPRPIFNRTDWLPLGLLLLLVLPLRLWLLHNTEVTARDSIGYIRYALQFERMPWQEVWVKNHQHPGYPLTVLAMSLPIRAIDGDTTPENMALAAQLVSLIVSLVLLAPMYLLGRQFFDRSVCFGATLLYQYLPISAQHLSDGVSEPMYLVFLVSALWQMVVALRDRHVANCIACGALTGLAYLVRPEGLLIVPAFALTLVVLQWNAELRLPRGRMILCGVTMLLAVMLVASIYVIVTGRITNKLTPLVMIERAFEQIKLWFTPAPHANFGGGVLFAATFSPSDSRTIRLTQSAAAYLKEIMQGFHYLGAIPTILGFWWSFPTLRRSGGFWGLMMYAAIHSVILIALAMTAAYVSDRHVMILVLGGSFFLVAGLKEAPRKVLSWFGENRSEWYLSPNVWFAVLFIAFFAACLPKAAQRLHGTRLANHEAGLWLAERIGPDDVVEDDHGWSAYYSGRNFWEGFEPELPEDWESTCFIVTTRSREPMIDALRVAKLSDEAKLVYVWPVGATMDNARVTVHAQPRTFDMHPWRLPRVNK